MKKIHISLFAIILYLFSGCSTDVDIYTKYKDITIVYGLLDQSDDTVWLKITKAYQGEGDALYYSKIPDSNNYPYKLNVTLVGVKNGVDVQTLTFDTITIHNKQAGDSIFYFPDQLMYYSVPSQPLNPGAEYHLTVERKDGEVKSKTPLVSDFYIIKPSGYTVNFAMDGTFGATTAENGKRYEFWITFNYIEVKNGTTDTVRKSLTWEQGIARSETTHGGSTVTVPYTSEQFFNMLETKLEKDPYITRYSGLVELNVACGSQALDTYLEINNGSNTFMNELPQFTNVDGDATGLFASRHSVTRSYKLSVKTEQTLIEDYPDLGFKLKP